MKPKKKEWFIMLLAIAITAQFFALLFGLAIMPIQQENEDFLYMLAGNLAGAFITVVSYYFGASHKK